MKIVQEGVESALAKLRQGQKSLEKFGNTSYQVYASSYSEVSGLDAAGAFHYTVSSVNEPEATKGVVTFFDNSATLLNSHLVGYVVQDVYNSLAVSDPMRDAADWSARTLVENTVVEPPIVNSFTAMPIYAATPQFIESLVKELVSTDTGSMESVSKNWMETARALTDASTSLPSAMRDLTSSAETESVQRAIDELTQIRTLTRDYSNRSMLMAVHAGNLVNLTYRNQFEAMVMLAIARASGAAPGSEEPYLQAFPAKLMSELLAVKPSFDNLLLPKDSPNGGENAITGPAALASTEFPKVTLPKPIQDVFTQAGYGDLAHAQTPTEVIEQFGRPNPDMLERIAAGATQTQAASAAAPSLPPIAGGGPSFAGTTPAFAGTGTGFTGAPTAGGATPFGAGTPGAGAPGVGGVGGFASPFGAGAAGAGALRAGAGAGAGGGGLDRSAAVPGSGLRGGRVGGVGGAGGLGGVGSGGTGGSGATGGLAPGVGSPGVGAPSAGATNVVAGNPGGAGAHGSRGGVVGGPAAGNGGRGRSNGKKGKVQAVTSAVEREGNLKALLGEAPEVVPGVIGSWVRQPRT